MNFLGGIRDYLKGKKTYITVGIGIILTLGTNYLGWSIPGFTPNENWLKDALELFGIGTLRAGMGTAVAVMAKK